MKLSRRVANLSVINLVAFCAIRVGLGFTLTQ